LVLALHVVVDKDDIPKEKFLGIYEFQKFDAKSMSERMLSILYEIDLRKLLAQCYDGASVMSGKHGGAQASISQHVTRDVPYIQYFNHQLHLVVIHVCDALPVVRRYFDIYNLLSKFLSTSSFSQHV